MTHLKNPLFHLGNWCVIQANTSPGRALSPSPVWNRAHPNPPPKTPLCPIQYRFPTDFRPKPERWWRRNKRNKERGRVVLLCTEQCWHWLGTLPIKVRLWISAPQLSSDRRHVQLMIRREEPCEVAQRTVQCDSRHCYSSCFCRNDALQCGCRCIKEFMGWLSKSRKILRSVLNLWFKH